MRFEVEVITEEVLPAIRSLIAEEMYSEYGFNQMEIADHLGVTQPAVSNYLTGSRADEQIVDKISSDPQIELLIDEATEKAVENENYSEEISKIVSNIRDKGILKEKFNQIENIM